MKISKKSITLFSILALVCTLVIGNIQPTAADDIDEDIQEVSEPREADKATQPDQVVESDGVDSPEDATEVDETVEAEEAIETEEAIQPEVPEYELDTEQLNDVQVVNSFFKEHQDDPDFDKKVEYLEALSNPARVANLLWAVGELDEYIIEGMEAEGEYVDLYYADRCDKISLAAKYFSLNDKLWNKAMWRAKRIVVLSKIED